MEDYISLPPSSFHDSLTWEYYRDQESKFPEKNIVSFRIFPNNANERKDIDGSDFIYPGKPALRYLTKCIVQFTLDNMTDPKIFEAARRLKKSAAAALELRFPYYFRQDCDPQWFFWKKCAKLELTSCRLFCVKFAQCHIITFNNRCRRAIKFTSLIPEKEIGVESIIRLPNEQLICIELLLVSVPDSSLGPANPLSAKDNFQNGCSWQILNVTD